jgi:hypothetical protein
MPLTRRTGIGEKAYGENEGLRHLPHRAREVIPSTPETFSGMLRCVRGKQRQFFATWLTRELCAGLS